MKIYTKTGDKGKTSLFDGTRVAKDTIRLETYGTIDELNSMLGYVLAELRIKNKEVRMKKELIQIQKDLFEIGSYLANPNTKCKIRDTKYFNSRVEDFEKYIDTMTNQLPILRNFILPGGGKVGALLQLSRTIARRCERRLVTLSQEEKVNESFIRYFNRLSDLLFTMARFANRHEKGKELIWERR